MATRRSLHEASGGYEQSRAAQRDLYGSRRIDASAPMADLTNNIPMSPPSGTGAGAWDAMFHGTKSPLAARTPQYGGTFGAPPARSVGDPGGPPPVPMIAPENYGPGGTTQSAPSASSLPLLAAGGVPKHSDIWGGGIKAIESITGTQGSFNRIAGLPTGQFGVASFVPGQNSLTNLAKRKTSPFQWGA